MRYLLILIFLVFCLMGCNKEPKENISFEPEIKVEEKAQIKKNVKEETPVSIEGLQIEDENIGEGPAVKEGDIVKVHYTGMLKNGKIFDTSKQSGREPFIFQVGAGSVIEGWEKGLIGMKVGGKRVLTIAPELAYGDRDMGEIPPNSTLIFQIELLGIE